MKQNWLFLFEFLIFDGVAVAWGLWQIRSVRRSIREDRERAQKSEEAAGHPEG